MTTPVVRYDYRQQSPITGQLGRTATNRKLTVVVTRYGLSTRVEGTFTVNSLDDVISVCPMTWRTIITATFAGDAVCSLRDVSLNLYSTPRQFPLVQDAPTTARGVVRVHVRHGVLPHLMVFPGRAPTGGVGDITTYRGGRWVQADKSFRSCPPTGPGLLLLRLWAGERCRERLHLLGVLLSLPVISVWKQILVIT